MEATVPGEGKYLKTCKGCKKQFRSNARNTRFAPTELKLCKCLERRGKQRAKRRKERAKYHRDPEKYRALSAARAASRKALLEWCKEHITEPRCAEPGCKVGGWNGVKNLHCHHVDGDPFSMVQENVISLNGCPLTNLQWRCRRHHEQADRAREGYGHLVVWKPQPKMSWLDFLVMIRKNETRTFFMVKVSDLYQRWLASDY